MEYRKKVSQVPGEEPEHDYDQPPPKPGEEAPGVRRSPVKPTQVKPGALSERRESKQPKPQPDEELEVTTSQPRPPAPRPTKAPEGNQQQTWDKLELEGGRIEARSFINLSNKVQAGAGFHDDGMGQLFGDLGIGNETIQAVGANKTGRTLPINPAVIPPRGIAIAFTHAPNGPEDREGYTTLLYRDGKPLASHFWTEMPPESALREMPEDVEYVEGMVGVSGTWAGAYIPESNQLLYFSSQEQKTNPGWRYPATPEEEELGKAAYYAMTGKQWEE